MRRIFSLFLLLLLVPDSSKCQALLHGSVRDKATQEPIAGASITARVDAQKRATVSNLYGKFRIAAMLPVTLQIHAVGYRDTVLKVLNDSVEILLERSASEQIVVTALRGVSAEQEVPVSTSIARNAEIQSHNPQGLDNALRYIPGVSMSEDQVSIRGSSGYSRSVGARVLLLLDGMPFLSADNGDMKFDAVPLLAVDRVEVVKGAGSALYGSSALGGVINVITREPGAISHSAVNLYSGIYDQPKYDEWRVPELGRRFASAEGGTSGTFRDLGYVLTGSLKRNEGYRVGDDNTRWNAFAKVATNLSASDKMTIEALIANEDHGGWIYWESLRHPLMPSDSLAAVNGRIHSRKFTGAGTWQRFWSDAVSTSLKVNEFYTNFTTDPLHSGDSAGAHSAAYSTNAELTSTWAMNAVMTLTSGLSLTHESVHSDLFLDHQGTQGGLFSQLEWRPVPELVLTPGLRFDAIGYDSVPSESRWSPKMGASYRVSHDIALRASYGSGYRAPSIGERFIQSTLSGFQVQPNLGLRSETSTSWEAGGAWQNDLFEFDAAGFYSLFHDLIEPGFVTTSSNAFIQFRNLTQARIIGHEETLNVSPFGDALNLTAAYTYIYPENSETHQILQFRPRHILQLNSRLGALHFTIGADYRYVSAYESMDSLLSVQIPDGGVREGAHVLDLRLGRDLNDLGIPLAATFQVQNALNYYYVEISGNLAPLRSYSLRLEANF